MRAFDARDPRNDHSDPTKDRLGMMMITDADDSDDSGDGQWQRQISVMMFIVRDSEKL